jgi:hypothetical protein
VSDAELHALAADFRDGLLAGRGSAAMCFAVAAPLQGLLSMCGVEAEMVEGSFMEWNHFWLRLPDGRVLDPTADQFNGRLDEPLPPVYIGPPTPIHIIADGVRMTCPRHGRQLARHAGRWICWPCWVEARAKVVRP